MNGLDRNFGGQSLTCMADIFNLVRFKNSKGMVCRLRGNTNPIQPFGKRKGSVGFNGQIKSFLMEFLNNLIIHLEGGFTACEDNRTTVAPGFSDFFNQLR